MVRLKLSHTDIAFTLLIDEDDDQKCKCGRGIKEMELSVTYLLTLQSSDYERPNHPLLIRESQEYPPCYPNYTQLTCDCGIVLKQRADYDLRWVSDDTGILTLNEGEES